MINDASSKNNDKKKNTIKVLDCGFEVSKFELQSHYYVRFWKRYEPPYTPSYGLDSINAVLL